jgi:hypothetical protein
MAVEMATGDVAWTSVSATFRDNVLVADEGAGHGGYCWSFYGRWGGEGG